MAMSKSDGATAFETILAIDWGGRRLGTAMGNSVARMASPMHQLTNDNNVYENIEELINSNQIDRIVVGLPRNMEGEETAQSAEIRQFAKNLKQQVDISVEMADETLSTRAGQELTGRFPDADKDSLAATVILQDYLDNL